MCIIAVCKTRKLTANELRNCFDLHSDGAGFAYSTGDKVYFEKGFMTLASLNQRYAEIPKGVPHVIHFRTQTSGGARDTLTHPYIIDAHSPLVLEGEVDSPVLFHNGIFSDWRSQIVPFFLSRNTKIPDGEWSDTRFAAIMASVVGENIFSFISGKWVVMTAKAIHLYGDFIEHKGVIFSNTGYKGTVQVGYNYRYGNYYNRTNKHSQAKKVPISTYNWLPKTGDA